MVRVPDHEKYTHTRTRIIVSSCRRSTRIRTSVIRMEVVVNTRRTHQGGGEKTSPAGKMAGRLAVPKELIAHTETKPFLFRACRASPVGVGLEILRLELDTPFVVLLELRPEPHRLESLRHRRLRRKIMTAEESADGQIDQLRVMALAQNHRATKLSYPNKASGGRVADSRDSGDVGHFVSSRVHPEFTGCD